MEAISPYGLHPTAVCSGMMMTCYESARHRGFGGGPTVGGLVTGFDLWDGLFDRQHGSRRR
jgi:hypothetical protein